MLQLVAPFFLLAINISISQTAEAFFFYQLEASRRISIILTANYSSAASKQQMCGLNVGPPPCEVKDRGCCSKSPHSPTRGQKTAIRGVDIIS